MVIGLLSLFTPHPPFPLSLSPTVARAIIDLDRCMVLVRTDRANCIVHLLPIRTMNSYLI
jgi:hypothetical protein